MEEKTRRGGLVGPVILIGLGLIFLLNNLGMLSWNVWEIIFQLWPLFLIAVGVDLLIGRRSTLGSLVVLAVILAIFAGGFVILRGRAGYGQPLLNEMISQPWDGAKSAKVTLSRDVGNVHVNALPNKTDTLLEGMLHLSERENVTRDFAVEDDVANFIIRGQRKTGPFIFGRHETQAWELGLNPDIPLQLETNVVVGECDLDLAELKVSALDVSMVVGDVSVLVPEQGRMQAKISGVIGKINVVIPEGVAVRVKTTKLLGSRHLPSEYQRKDEVFVSAGYEMASNRVDLDINLLIGDIVVSQYGVE